MPKKGPYDAQFRANAVELPYLPGRTIVGVSRDLGISAETLRSWRRRSGQDHPVPEKAENAQVPPEVTAELRELRKKVREQEQVIHVLEKATAWFADPNRRGSQ